MLLGIRLEVTVEGEGSKGGNRGVFQLLATCMCLACGGELYL